MKKIALTSLLAMFAVSAANAETNYFVGGSFGLGTDNDHESTFSIAPEFGWKYNSNWDFGVSAGFHHEHDSDWIDEDVYSYGANVFARYNVAEFGGVKLLLKGSIGAEFWNYDNVTDSFTGVEIIPMITYDISESFTLYAQLDFLKASFGYSVEHGIDDIDRSWEAGIFANSGNVANTEDFQIGFTYNF